MDLSCNLSEWPHPCKLPALYQAVPEINSTGRGRLGPAEHKGNNLSDTVLTTSICLQGRLLGVEGEMMPSLAEEVIALSGGCDLAVAANAQRITTELRREEKKFGSTLEAGAGSTCTIRHPSPI